MRRKDREITDFAEIKALLDKSKVLRIALNNGAFPYVIPVNFGYYCYDSQRTLFFHGATEGAKHAVIRNDNRVTFEVDCSHDLILPSGKEGCTASFAYESVIGQGYIEKASEEEKEHLLILRLQHYGIDTCTFRPTTLQNTVVYKINVSSYTAKRFSAQSKSN